MDDVKKVISTKNAPAAIGPYSQGIVASGETCYVSGQLPIDPATGMNLQEQILKARPDSR